MSASENAVPSRNLLGGLLGLLGMSGIAGVLIAVLITPIVAVAGVATNSTITLFESLPDYLEIGDLQQKTELYAKQGGKDVKFAEFYAQNREEVDLDQISQYAIDAAISTEDPRFYEHGGVDVISATRALFASVLSDSGAGASTITMQYVRNVRVQTAESILDPAKREEAYKEATEQSIGRKLQEMRLAIGVEQQYNKQDILRGYLNIALFGGQVYGIESAAQYYFGKPAKDLTLAESASLIATVQNPNVYRVDYPENLENNKMRRDYVLMRMLDEGKITQEEHDAAVAEEVKPNVQQSKHGCQNAEGNAQYFCDYVRNVILNDAAFGETFEERLFSFQTKGYQIHTTIDLDLQAATQQAISESINSYYEGVNIGSASSVVEVGTGRVLAMAQNTVFDETAEASNNPGHTSINYNTDYAYGGSTGFQVGSTYKMFTLAEWFASGHGLQETINAQNRTFNLANFRTSCNEPFGGTWSPTNEGGVKVGSTNAVTATMNSTNTAFVAMAEKLDQCRIRDTAMALGAHRADGQINQDNPAAVLGTNEVSPLAMAVATAGLANKGKSCSPIAIDSITLHDGTEVPAPKSSCVQAVTPEVAAQANYALERTANGGSVTSANPGIVPMMGKTGTSENANQTWLVASTTKTAVATWIGNVTGQSDIESSGLSQRWTIVRKIMQYAMPAYGGSAFEAPPQRPTPPQSATIPDLTGRTVDEAKTALEQLGYTVNVGQPISSQQTAGTIAAQLPSPNTTVNKGTTVTITPSAGSTEGAGEFTMPDVTSMPIDTAIAELTKANFSGTIRQFTEPATAESPAGTVVRTDPEPGINVPGDSEIKIYVAQ